MNRFFQLSEIGKYTGRVYGRIRVAYTCIYRTSICTYTYRVYERLKITSQITSLNRKKSLLPALQRLRFFTTKSTKNTKFLLCFAFAPSRLRAFAPSRLRAFALSYLRAFVPSRLRAFAPSCLRAFVPSRLRAFAPSRFRAFAPIMYNN
jgi:hypothetical protein